MVSSFGAESAVLLHMVAEIDPNTPILFLNTGKLFGETLRYRDRLQDVLGLGDVRTLAPILADRAARDPDGTLWSRDTDACCDFRKVDPARPRAGAVRGPDHRPQALPDPRARRHAGGGIFRRPLPLQSAVATGRWPIWKPTSSAHNLPRHPLVEDGYPSIGCMPCTRRVQAGEDYRAGRWAGLDKDECGIHGVGRRRDLGLEAGLPKAEPVAKPRAYQISRTCGRGGMVDALP